MPRNTTSTPEPRQLAASHLPTRALSHLSTRALSHLPTPALSHLSTPAPSHLPTPPRSHLPTPARSHLSTPARSHRPTRPAPLVRHPRLEPRRVDDRVQVHRPPHQDHPQRTSQHELDDRRNHPPLHQLTQPGDEE